MIKTDNSTASYDKMMALFRLFGAKKARRARGQQSDGGSRGQSGRGTEQSEDITLEDAGRDRNRNRGAGHSQSAPEPHRQQEL